MFKPNQVAAIKKLEAALLGVKRAGLAMVGVDDNLLITVADAELADVSLRTSSCEAVQARHNADRPGTTALKHYGCYRDSGGA